MGLLDEFNRQAEQDPQPKTLLQLFDEQEKDDTVYIDPDTPTIKTSIAGEVIEFPVDTPQEERSRFIRQTMLNNYKPETERALRRPNAAVRAVSRMLPNTVGSIAAVGDVIGQNLQDPREAIGLQAGFTDIIDQFPDVVEGSKEEREAVFAFASEIDPKTVNSLFPKGKSRIRDFYGANITKPEQIGIQEIWAYRSAKKSRQADIDFKQSKVGSIVSKLGKTISKFSIEQQIQMHILVQQPQISRDPETFKGDFLDNPSVKRAVLTAIDSGGSFLLASTIAITTRNPMAGARVLGVIEAAPVFQEARDKGKDLATSNMFFLGTSAVITRLENMVFLRLLKGLKARGIGAVAANVAEVSAIEGVEEGLQGLTINLVTKLGIDETQRLGEGIFEGMLVGSITGGFAATVISGSASGIDALIQRAREAGITPEQLDQLQQELAKEFIQDIEGIDSAVVEDAKTILEQAGEKLTSEAGFIRISGQEEGDFNIESDELLTDEQLEEIKAQVEKQQPKIIRLSIKIGEDKLAVEAKTFSEIEAAFEEFKAKRAGAEVDLIAKEQDDVVSQEIENIDAQILAIKQQELSEKDKDKIKALQEQANELADQKVRKGRLAKIDDQIKNEDKKLKDLNSQKAKLEKSKKSTKAIDNKIDKVKATLFDLREQKLSVAKGVDITSKELLVTPEQIEKAQKDIAKAKQQRIESLAQEKQSGLIRALKAKAQGFKQGFKVGKRFGIKQITNFRQTIEVFINDAQLKSDTKNKLRKIKESIKSEKSFEKGVEKLLLQIEVLEELEAKQALVKEINRLNEKKVPIEYQDQIDQILEDIDLKKRSPKTLRQRESRQAFVEREKDAGTLDFLPPEFFLNLTSKSFDELSLEELEDIRNKIAVLTKLGQLKGKLIARKKAKDLVTLVDKLTKTIVDRIGREVLVDVKSLPLTGNERDTARQAATKIIQGYFAVHRKAEFALRVMGIADEIFEPIIDGTNRAIVLKEQDSIRLTRAFKLLEDSMINIMIKDIEINEVPADKDGTKLKMSKEQIIGLALNNGNTGNRQRLIEGNGFTQEQIDAIIENHLNNNEKAFVELIFQLTDGKWNDTVDTTVKLTGLRPNKVDGRYFPIVVDYEMMKEKAKQKLKEQKKKGRIIRDKTDIRNAINNIINKVKGKKKVDKIKDHRERFEKAITRKSPEVQFLFDKVAVIGLLTDLASVKDINDPLLTVFKLELELLSDELLQFFVDTARDFGDTGTFIFDLGLKEQDSRLPEVVIQDKITKQAENELSEIESKKNRADSRNLFQQIFHHTFVQRNFTKNRTGGADPVNLNVFSVILNHIDSVNHFNALAIVVRDTQQIFNHPTFQVTVEEQRDTATYNELQKWLRDIANPKFLRAENMTDKLMRNMRINSTAAILGYKVSVSLVQGLSYTLAIDELSKEFGVGKGLGLGLHGLKEFWKDPRTAFEFIYSRSPFMRNSKEQFDRELRDHINRGELDKFLKVAKKDLKGKVISALDDVTSREALFSWIRAVDTITRFPAWLSAYEAKFAETQDDAVSSRFADGVVRRTQPTASIENLSGIMRGGEFQKLWTSFMTFFSVELNQIVDVIDRLKYDKNHRMRKAQEFAESYAWIIIVPAFFVSLLKGGFEDPREAKFWNRFIGDVIGLHFAGLFLMREIVNAMTKGFQLGVPPAFTPAKELVLTVTSKDIGKKIEHGVKFIGSATGRIPVQAVDTVGGFIDLMNDETDDWRRLVYTEGSLKESKIKFFDFEFGSFEPIGFSK